MARRASPPRATHQATIMKNVQKYCQKLAEEHPKEEQGNSPYKMKYNSIHVHPKRSK
jgi:hypothetical protein